MSPHIPFPTGSSEAYGLLPILAALTAIFVLFTWVRLRQLTASERPATNPLAIYVYRPAQQHSVETFAVDSFCGEPVAPFDTSITIAVPREPGNYPLIVYLQDQHESIASGQEWQKYWAEAGYAVMVLRNKLPATVLDEELSAKLRNEYVPMVRRLLTALGNRGTAPFASINLKNPVFVGCGSGADIARALADAHRADIRPASEKGLPQVLILLDPHAGKFAEGRDGKVSSCEGHAIFVLKVGDQEKILQFSIYPLTNQEICPSSPALEIPYADAMRHLSLGFLDAIVKKDPVAIEWLEHDAGRWLESVGKLQYA